MGVAYSECWGSMVSSGHVLKNPFTRLVWEISGGREITCCRERGGGRNEGGEGGMREREG